jgi:hypothetical protein
MIVKIQKAGSSFKGLANYLTEQKDRVAWTHSLNCANDDVLSVVHEMVTTYSQAELLKEQAGVHAGGSVVEAPVKHISLNWHPDETPTQEHMIATAEQFLKKMAWDEHQALLVAHNDKPHPHVHIELNRIHPETGKVLDDSYERRRASDWALEYERENGLVRCPERELHPAERTREPSRQTWEKLREAEETFIRDEAASLERLEEDYFRRGEQKEAAPSREWHLLKAHQRAERDSFRAEGKIIYKELRNEVNREVRAHYKEIWGEYYAACREGIDSGEAEAWKSDIKELQKDMFEVLKADRYADLRASRDEDYKQLLLDQKDERHELHRAQTTGRTSYELLDLVGNEPEVASYLQSSKSSERNDDEKVSEPDAKAATQEAGEGEFDNANDNSQRHKSGLEGAAGIAGGLVEGIATIVERLFDSFFGGGSQPVMKRSAPEPSDDLRMRREALRFQKVEEAIEQAQLERERQRDNPYLEERQRRRD